MAQKKAEFEDSQAMKKACSQVNHVERQERFWHEHQSQKVRFENEQWEQHCLFEVSLVEEEAKFQVKITQMRFQHRKQIDEESQKSLTNHIQAVGEIIWKATPPMILQPSAGLLATQGATAPAPIPVYQPSTSVQSVRTSQNSGCEPTATQQAVESNGSGSISK